MFKTATFIHVYKANVSYVNISKSLLALNVSFVHAVCPTKADDLKFW